MLMQKRAKSAQRFIWLIVRTILILALCQVGSPNDTDHGFGCYGSLSLSVVWEGPTEGTPTGSTEFITVELRLASGAQQDERIYKTPILFKS